MNQILQTQDTKLLKPNGIKKILLALLILVIVAGFGGLYIYENTINGKFINTKKETPIITLTPKGRNQLMISVQSKVGISKVEYILNNGDSKTLDITNESFVEETIDMVTGENLIYISVVDINQKETIKQENFLVEAPKPLIELAVVGNNIKIVVTSEVELSEITYKWNLENEKKENMKTYKDRLSFEKQLEIPIGQNTLTIVATDINGEKTEKTQEIKGVTKATITTELIGEYLHFTVKGKENIQKVEFEFNGKKYLMNTETFGKTKNVHYKVKLLEGTNYLIITSITESGGKTIETVIREYKK